MKRSQVPIVAIFTALTIALVIAWLPTWRIESVVAASGLPALLPAAAPPLGMTARVTLMLAAALLVAAPLGVGLWLLLPAKRRRRRRAAPEVSVRRADAHPDAPPRPPVRAARDLGKPFLDPLEPVETEIPLPRDLDMPMAIFDPAAVPQVPAAPPQAVRPLFRPTPIYDAVPPVPLAEAYAMPPAQAEPIAATAEPAEPAPAPVVELASEPVYADLPVPEPVVSIVEPEPEPEPEPDLEPEPEPTPPEAEAIRPEPAPLPSIDALLDRLDQGLQRRRSVEQRREEAVRPVQSNGLASALGALRRMAGGE